MQTSRAPDSLRQRPEFFAWNDVQDFDVFWSRTRAYLNAAVPVDFCCLNVYPFSSSPPAAWLSQNQPGPQKKLVLRGIESLPFVPPMCANPPAHRNSLRYISKKCPELRPHHFEDVAPPSSYEACLLFWSGPDLECSIGLHRRSDCEDFQPDEIAWLLQLHPFLKKALERAIDLQREKTSRSVVDQLFDQSPVATIVLSWKFEVTSVNLAGRKMLLCWNSGPQAAEQLKLEPVCTIPPEMITGCVALWEGAKLGRASSAVSKIQKRLMIRHPQITGLCAEIEIARTNDSRLDFPTFLIRIWNQGNALGSNDDDLTGRQLALLARLSPCERQVAWLAGQGRRSHDISRELRKSELTIKKQLQSVYRKLSINGRSRLIALIRSGVDLVPTES